MYFGGYTRVPHDLAFFFLLETAKVFLFVKSVLHQQQRIRISHTVLYGRRFQEMAIMEHVPLRSNERTKEIGENEIPSRLSFFSSIPKVHMHSGCACICPLLWHLARFGEHQVPIFYSFCLIWCRTLIGKENDVMPDNTPVMVYSDDGRVHGRIRDVMTNPCTILLQRAFTWRMRRADDRVDGLSAMSWE